MLGNRRSLSSFQSAYPSISESQFSAVVSSAVKTSMLSNVATSTSLHTSNIHNAFSSLCTKMTQRGIQYASNTIAQRGGFMAEDFHAGTYNLDAIIKRGNPDAKVLVSNAKGSADIIYYDDNKQASLKYCSNAKASVNSQQNPKYGSQNRIIPSDQLEEAKSEIEKQIKGNIAKGRSDVSTNQKQVKELLTDRITGKNGVSSTPLTKKQDMEIAKAIKVDKSGNITIDEKKINNILKETGVTNKVNKSIFKNELKGVGLAVAIGLGVGFTISFAVSLAQSGISPESVKYAFAEGSKVCLESGVMSVVGYGVGRTIGQLASNVLTGVLENLGLVITENIKTMCNMGVIGSMMIVVFSAWQFIKLKQSGLATKEALVQVGKQALFSIGILTLSIVAQGFWVGPAGMIVSLSIAAIIIVYALVNATNRRCFDEKLDMCVIDKMKPVYS